MINVAATLMETTIWQTPDGIAHNRDCLRKLDVRASCSLAWNRSAFVVHHVGKIGLGGEADRQTVVHDRAQHFEGVRVRFCSGCLTVIPHGSLALRQIAENRSQRFNTNCAPVRSNMAIGGDGDFQDFGGLGHKLNRTCHHDRGSDESNKQAWHHEDDPTRHKISDRECFREFAASPGPWLFESFKEWGGAALSLHTVPDQTKRNVPGEFHKR